MKSPDEVYKKERRESACSEAVDQLRNWMCGEEIMRAVGVVNKRLFLFS